ncbi:ABC transporter substrate-binding protein [Mesobacterium sp. TK19101]|uniref:ABC transporter substrate-binding protein n=1 Tax=Mesobacterium hydrothermale TaxID=3111907 RepID=A0ABU6HH99_9RHOB|nr:ABC transporter substrate-binding protein [Mesobacterium sp. TK19101]MEC3861736.1 ABC transporter substrate-binding protein [Mesobacterium sp. TK19101]
MRVLFLLFALFAALPLRAEVTVTMVYLRVEQDRPPVLSNLDPVPDRLGLDGAEIALADNVTTGRFLGQTHRLEIMDVPPGADPLKTAKNALALASLLIVDAPAPVLVRIADLPEARGALLFNTARADDALRGADCRANLLHSLPSFAMRADALMQFARFKRWSDLALISGTHPDDTAFAQALRVSARKYGLTLRAEKTWAFDADMRRNAAQEVPVFTQELGAYDLLLVADELHDFARYIPFNTWLPRPVAGSEGLRALAWAAPVEQWGAAQLQARFTDHAGRDMQAQDYAAWAAVRAIGEAVTRTGSADPATLRAYLLGPDFALAGFKGRPLSFRAWNGQMRQPIPLVTRTALAEQAPLPGYLHQHSELDTLGQDRPETTCEAFR